MLKNNEEFFSREKQVTMYLFFVRLGYDFFLINESMGMRWNAKCSRIPIVVELNDSKDFFVHF